MTGSGSGMDSTRTVTTGIYLPATTLSTPYTPVVVWTLVLEDTTSDADTDADAPVLSYRHFWDSVREWTNLRSILFPPSAESSAQQEPQLHVYAAHASVRERVVAFLERSYNCNNKQVNDDINQDDETESCCCWQVHTEKPSKNVSNRSLQNLLEERIENGAYRISGDLNLQTADNHVLPSAGWFLQSVIAVAHVSDRKFTLAHAVLDTCVVLDPTAADALFLWPPRHQDAQAIVTSNNSSTSLWGLVSRHVKSPMGQDVLRHYLRQPLRDYAVLLQRQDAVAQLVDYGVGGDSVMPRGLPNVWKLSRTLHGFQKITNAASGNDNNDGERSSACTNVLETLYRVYLLGSQHVPQLLEQLETLTAATPNNNENGDSSSQNNLLISLQTELQQILTDLQQAVALAEAVLDLDLAPREYMVNAQYHPDLVTIRDELTANAQNIQDCHQEFQQSWDASSTSTGSTVKLEDTADEVLFRLANTNDTKVLQQRNDVSVHKLLKNGVSFSTAELRRLGQERQDLRAEYRTKSLRVVQDCGAVAATYAPVLELAACTLGAVDALQSMAMASRADGYVRPQLINDDDDDSAADSRHAPVLQLDQARHPCVELQVVQDAATEYIPNDVHMGSGTNDNGASDGDNHNNCRLLLVTGPNMGGKSTYIRAVAAIQLLAQVGLYVPCSSAKMTLCDWILCRVGAGDYQDRGISTFLAEMLESSSILRTATSRSLIIIDELGRGTSTFDGYGLARAIAEYLVQNVGNLTIFATHFHELTALEQHFSSTATTDAGQSRGGGAVQNCHVTAQKTSHGLTFLYQVRHGPCLESFGIQVAELAGVPASVVQDARLKARELEQFDDTPANDDNSDKAFLERFAQIPRLDDLVVQANISDEEKRATLRRALLSA